MADQAKEERVPDAPVTKRSTRAFRPDIQGMRALAVVVVILAHAGLPGVLGGFVGVDVFFVISGFLITSLLYREATRTGRISLREFYRRRARRILPAAALVIVATLVLAVALVPLVDAVDILTDGVFAALFVANVRFAAVGTDYFAKGQTASPLQHYWSLSVEEQYYLVWPLLLIGCLLLARRAAARRTSGAHDASATPPQGGSPRTTVLAVLGVVLLASLAWSVVQTHTAPTVAYFSSLTRTWELAAGSLLAVALSGRTLRAPRWLLEVGGWAGLLAIVAAVVGFGAQTPFPGYAAALPVAGAVLLILTGAGEQQPTSMARLLSVRPALILGNWSYSLYLWHWPLLRIAEDRLGVARLDVLPLVAVLVLTLALSGLTYHFVETPFRSGSRIPLRVRGLALYPLSLLLVVATAGAGHAYVAQQLDHGDNPAIQPGDFAGRSLSKDPTIALVEASVLAARQDDPIPGNLQPSLLGLRQQVAPLGDCDYRTGTTALCNEGDPDASRSIVLVGDSHARAWAPAISAIGKRDGYATYNLVLTGCPAAQVVQGDQTTKRPLDSCQDFKQFSLDQIEKLHPDLVVLSSSALGPVIDDAGDPVGIEQGKQFRTLYRAGFDAELAALQPLADRVVVLGDTPKLPREPGVCLSTRGADLGDCLMQRNGFAHVVQQDLRDVARARGITFVDAMPWFCYERECPAVVGRTVTLRDSEHMTPTYAVELADPLARKLGITTL